MSDDTAFDAALTFVLSQEGGFEDNPADPGGATNYGITQRTFAEWLQGRMLPTRFVKTITRDEVTAIYRENYWDRFACAATPWPLFAFDSYVQHRPETVGTFLQMPTLADAMWARMYYYTGLGNFKVFGRGWIRRMCDLRTVLFAEGEQV